MNYRNHLIGGAVVYAILLYLLSFTSIALTIEQKCIALLMCLLGALFPDIDTKSKFQLWVYRISFVSLALLTLLFPYNPYIWLGTFLLLIPLVVNHRGIFHNFWFLILIPLALALITGTIYPRNQIYFLLYAGFFISGALSHLILDKKH